MYEEYNALIADNTWGLVLSQPLQNLVGSKWVYRVKYKSNCIVERYKAQLMARVFINRHVLITMRLLGPLSNQPLFI